MHFLEKYNSKLPEFHKFHARFGNWSQMDFSYADIYLPELPGIYAVLRAHKKGSYHKTVLYVGVSQNLRNRFMNGHHRFYEMLREGCKTIKYCPFPLDVERKDMELIEAAYMHYHKPVLNLVYPFAFSEEDLIHRSNANGVVLF